MLNPYHLEMVRQGAEAWNQWKVDSQVTNPELSGADLSEVDFTGYSLAGSNLCEANLCRAVLSEADLSGGNLSMAYLIEANLFRANLSEANLVRSNMAKANFFGADLTKANLSDANLSGANFTMADLATTNLTKANLSLANFTKSHFKDTIGMPHGVFGIENSASVAIFTPALVHQKMDLITRDMLGGKSVKKSDPIQVHISIQGHTSFYDERTLMNTVLDVMKLFGFAPTENPKISEGAFCAIIMCQGKGYSTSEKVREILTGLYEGFSRILKKEDTQSGLITQQTKAIENLMSVFRSIPNQLTIQIDHLVIMQSYQQGKGGIGIHQISEVLREELANNPQILMSSHLLKKILDDQKGLANVHAKIKEEKPGHS